ncbi:hypothetical protein C0995_012315 [Termitomyces sp. Mi166|nr:hypothetical protein C0995_012315 [Termitomyces sp. Mi166\
MGFWLCLVGGLQVRFGAWGQVGTDTIWLVANHEAATQSSSALTSFFAITIGPVSWTYPAEFYSLKIRGKAVSLTTATNWAFNTALAFAVPPGLASIVWKTYFIFATINFAACIHIFFMYPETVGHTLEEVEEIFQQGHVFTAWKIGREVGKKTVHEVITNDKVVHRKSLDEKSST